MFMLLFKVGSFATLHRKGRKMKEQEVVQSFLVPGYCVLQMEEKASKKVTKTTTAIRLIGFSIDGFEGMPIGLQYNNYSHLVHVFFSFGTCSCCKIQQNLAENLNII